MKSEVSESGESSSQVKTRQRSLKLKGAEVELLVDEVVAHYYVLFGSCSNKTTTARKQEIWREIQQKINALGVTQRSIKILKKRWTHTKRRTREKLAKNRAAASTTGWGPSAQEPLTPMEEMIASILLPEQVEGLSGQIGTCRDPEKTQQSSGSTNVLEGGWSAGAHSPNSPAEEGEMDEREETPSTAGVYADQPVEEDKVSIHVEPITPSPHAGTPQRPREQAVTPADYDSVILEQQRQNHSMLQHSLQRLNQHMSNQNITQHRICQTLERWQENSTEHNRQMLMSMAAINNTLRGALDVFNRLAWQLAERSSETPGESGSSTPGTSQTTTPSMTPPQPLRRGLRIHVGGISRQMDPSPPEGKRGRRQ
ncbi:myb-related transcription factor, partner of profilin-like [Acipenser ruthenus]|uniref:myb-related transcription factor, partner of profilin-like n=1 Tax=Acipenser ruthenus TaxID=7906 RepID=UPI001560EB2C|nr:myb-related transcription factor, partner of profilin-like [Acipenser ruthenus]